MDIDPSVLWDFAGEVVGSVRPSARKVPATVTRVDADGTVWVTTGDGTEAPAATCGAGVSVGDVVSVEWSGAQMGVTANTSDPSAGSRAVGAVQRAVRAARSVADGAQAIANAIGQHFWADDNGAHVSTEAGNATGARNILMNSLGILLRQEGTWLASFSDSAVAFFDGLGNTAANVVAQFGADGATIGRSDESHVELDYHSMQLVDKEGDTYFHVSDLRDANGIYLWKTTVELETSQSSLTIYITGGLSVTLTSPFAVTCNGVDVSEHFAITIRDQQWMAVSESGYTCSAGEYTLSVEAEAWVWAAQPKAYTFGSRKLIGQYDRYAPMGFMSTAIGENLIASASYSYAEGFWCEATGAYSHAEGYLATAKTNAHAEGYYTEASGVYSHAQNNHTVAAYDSQTAIGKYNDNDPNNAFEIGNGTADNARSNAFAVDWDGNLTAGNFRDAAMTRDLGSSGTIRACRIGNMLIMSGSLSGCTVSDTFTWTHLAHLDPSALGITSVTSMGATVEVSGGGPSYAGTTNAGGTARMVDGVLYAEMQTNAAFSSKFVKFIITAYVE